MVILGEIEDHCLERGAILRVRRKGDRVVKSTWNGVGVYNVSGTG